MKKYALICLIAFISIYADDDLTLNWSSFIEDTVVVELMEHPEGRTVIASSTALYEMSVGGALSVIADGLVMNDIAPAPDGGFITCHSDSLVLLDMNGQRIWAVVPTVPLPNVTEIKKSSGVYPLKAVHAVSAGYVYLINMGNYAQIGVVNSEGNYLWHIERSDPDGAAISATSICEVDGGIVVAGLKTPMIAKGNMSWMTKYALDSGEKIWDKDDLPKCEIWNMITSSSGEIVCTGLIESMGIAKKSKTQWFPATGTLFLSVDKDGATVHLKYYSRDVLDHGSSIHETNDGGFLIGAYGGKYSWDETNDPVRYIVRTDSNGDSLWDLSWKGIYAGLTAGIQLGNDEFILYSGDTLYSFGGNETALNGVYRLDNNYSSFSQHDRGERGFDLLGKSALLKRNFDFNRFASGIFISTSNSNTGSLLFLNQYK